MYMLHKVDGAMTAAAAQLVEQRTPYSRVGSLVAAHGKLSFRPHFFLHIYISYFLYHPLNSPWHYCLFSILFCLVQMELAPKFPLLFLFHLVGQMSRVDRARTPQYLNKVLLKP